MSFISPGYSLHRGFNLKAGDKPVGDRYYMSDSLLLHCNGANGSVIFTDSSSNPKVITPFGGAVISTAQSRFNGASAFFNGVDSYLHCSQSVDFAFGNAPFTIEMSTRHDAANVAGAMFATRAVATLPRGILLQIFAGTIYAYIGDDITWFASVSAPAPADYVWNDFALQRDATTLKLFINGVTVASSPCGNTAIVTAPDNTCQIGRDQGNPIGLYPYAWYGGYIDEVRVTTGIARYTGDYQRPTEPFPDWV